MPKPEVEVLGQDGNIFFIAGKAQRALDRAGEREKGKEMVGRLGKCGSYSEALTMIQEYVEFV